MIFEFLVVAPWAAGATSIWWARKHLSAMPPIKKKKRGPKVGSTPDNAKTIVQWHDACKTYRDLQKGGNKMTQKGFLISELSGDSFSGTPSEIVSFSRMLKEFDSGTLRPNIQAKRRSTGKFDAVEKKLVEYLDLRARLHQHDKLGLSYDIMRSKALQFAEQLGVTDFLASNGWIQNVLRRSGKARVVLHGEAGELSESEARKTIDEWKEKEYLPMIEKLGITPETCYNADQTGLFYQKLPNTMYLDKEKLRTVAGAKQMKDKTRVTLMVATAASGDKIPMAMIGVAKEPVCFQLCVGRKPPMPYNYQRKAWFTKEITKWWIWNVLKPWHEHKHGSATKALLLLDNCGAHKLDAGTLLPPWLNIVFLPENMTSRMQPADMGMIAALKVGYKTTMLKKLLEIFDMPGGYERAAAIRKKMKPGLRGLDFGGKPHVLDAMNIVQDLWTKDDKFARKDGIRRCWRKAGILPISWEADINADLGSASTSAYQRKLSVADCTELCEMMEKMIVQAELVDTTVDAIALQGSFVGNGNIARASLAEMVHTWIDIEDQPEVITAEVEEAMEELEREENVLDISDGEGMNDTESEASEEEELEDGEELLNHQDAEAMILKVKKSAPTLGISVEGTLMLDRFLTHLRKSKLEKKSKDTTMHQFFSRKPKES